MENRIILLIFVIAFLYLVLTKKGKEIVNKFTIWLDEPHMAGSVEGE